MKKIILMLLCLLNAAAYAQVPIAAQWHYEGNHPDPNISGTDHSGWDWVFSILPTAKKEYIACGYTAHAFYNGSVWVPRVQAVIFKLNNLGKLVWIKKVDTYVGGGTDLGGTLYQVIKTPNGYAACGGLTDGTRKAVIVEFDEDGNYMSGYPKAFPLTTTSVSTTTYGTMIFSSNAARSIAMSPDNSEYVIAGDAFYANGNPVLGKAFIAKVNYSTLTMSTGTNDIFFGGGEYSNYDEPGTTRASI